MLHGPRTASSGEAVAIAFRGRPLTRSFGLPTAGLSTANAGFGMSDGGVIVLTVATDVDRNGTIYGAAVEPDERASWTVANPTDASDGAAQAAIAWLREQPACAG